MVSSSREGTSASSALGLLWAAEELSSLKTETRSGISSSLSLEVVLVGWVVGKSGWLRM